MNVVELNRALKQLRLGGMAAVLEVRLRQAQAESMAPSTSSPVWLPMNSPAVPTAYSIADASRLSSDIR